MLGPPQLPARRWESLQLATRLPAMSLLVGAEFRFGGDSNGDHFAVDWAVREIDALRSDTARLTYERDQLRAEVAALRAEGVTRFDQYLMVPGADPLPDFFLPEVRTESR